MRIDIRGPLEKERGQAAAESLLVIMALVLIIFGGLELSRGVAIRAALDSGAGAGVRALGLDPTQWAFTSSLVQQAVNQNVMGTSPAVTLLVLDTGGTSHDPTWLAAQPFGTAFILEVEVPFQASIPFMSPDAITIRVRHWGIVERYP